MLKVRLLNFISFWASTKPHRKHNFVCDNEPVLFRPRPKVNSGIDLFNFLLGSEYTRDKHRASSFHGPDLITGVLKCDFMRRSVTRMAKRLVFVLCHVKQTFPTCSTPRPCTTHSFRPVYTRDRRSGGGILARGCCSVLAWWAILYPP